jgi:hypothetical protein
MPQASDLAVMAHGADRVECWDRHAGSPKQGKLRFLFWKVEGLL